MIVSWSEPAMKGRLATLFGLKLIFEDGKISVPLIRLVAVNSTFWRFTLPVFSITKFPWGVVPGSSVKLSLPPTRSPPLFFTSIDGTATKLTLSAAGVINFQAPNLLSVVKIGALALLYVNYQYKGIGVCDTTSFDPGTGVHIGAANIGSWFKGDVLWARAERTNIGTLEEAGYWDHQYMDPRYVRTFDSYYS